jgi:hypothetical protein
MSRRWPFLGWMVAWTVTTALTSGCVDRRFVIESDPQNANVTVNGRPVGATPADVQFIHYGTYRFVFDHDGFQRLTVDEEICSPWYEYFPLEFVAENLLPFTLRDIHYIRKALEPIVIVPDDVLQKRGDQLRLQGQSIGPQPGHGGTPPPASGAALPPVPIVPPG